MKITAVHTHLLHHALDKPFQSSFSGFRARSHCLVEIVCDDGLIGWGECLGPADINAAIVRAMTPHLLGRDPRDIEPIWLYLYSQFRDQGQRGVIITALSGIDIALWDIAGKHYGAPVFRLLGGAFRAEVPAYATGGFRPEGMKDRAAHTAAEMRGYVDRGFGAVKIKIGFGRDSDLETIAAVRAAIGPGAALMIDANHGYDAVAAIALGRAAAVHDISWFEEPVVPETLGAYCDVRRGQPIPVAGGETWHGRWAMHQALEARAVDILQPDVCGLGGFTEARKIIDLAVLYGVRCVPHVWGTGVAIAASLHFHAILPPAPPAHESRAAPFEFDCTPNPFRQAILKTPIEAVKGIVKVPDGPGLGIEIDRDQLKRFAPA